jgi:hypothetical protein
MYADQKGRVQQSQVNLLRAARESKHPGRAGVLDYF